jgi:hypothetical protein
MQLIHALSHCATAYMIATLNHAAPLCHGDNLTNTEQHIYYEHNLKLHPEHNRVYIVLAFEFRSAYQQYEDMKLAPSHDGNHEQNTLLSQCWHNKSHSYHGASR